MTLDHDSVSFSAAHDVQVDQAFVLRTGARFWVVVVWIIPCTYYTGPRILFVKRAIIFSILP